MAAPGLKLQTALRERLEQKVHIHDVLLCRAAKIPLEYLALHLWLLLLCVRRNFFLVY